MTKIDGTTELDTKSIDWTKPHGALAIANATDRILNGETVKFITYGRGYEALCRMIPEGTYYVGIYLVDTCNALRVSNSQDLLSNGSHSLIASWTPQDQLTNPAMIAATIARFLYKTGVVDVFVSE